MNLLRVVLIARGNTKNKASPQSHSLWKSKEAGSLTSSMRNLKKDISLTKQGVKIISSNIATATQMRMPLGEESKRVERTEGAMRCGHQILIG